MKTFNDFLNEGKTYSVTVFHDGEPLDYKDKYQDFQKLIDNMTGSNTIIIAKGSEGITVYYTKQKLYMPNKDTYVIK